MKARHAKQIRLGVRTSLSRISARQPNSTLPWYWSPQWTSLYMADMSRLARRAFLTHTERQLLRDLRRGVAK